MSPKTIRYIANTIKTGLFILPVVSLLVSQSMFFPFITTKNFFFRIVVELLFFFWVLLMVFDKKYRPTKTPLLIAVSALFLILTLSTIFSENAYRSFWSNYERMEGLVGYLHLFAYFLILTSVFKTKRDWKWFFASMLFVSMIAVFYGFLQASGKAEVHQSTSRLDASFGNATYFAIYMIFHMFITSLFFCWFKNIWFRISLAIFFVLQFLIMFFTATRGAVLGFFGGLFLLGILMAVFSKNKKIRYGFLGVVFLMVVLVGLFFMLKDSTVVEKNQTLRRLAAISLTERTVESRLTIWGMSWNGFQEHPVLGWGPENYNLVFNKYYEPKLWKQEPWFDRSHNVLFDWLITTGIVGFLTYVSIFVLAIYMAWQGYRKKYFSLYEAAAVTSVLAAYTFHNIFVFDNLTSYFAFFAVLGFVQFRWVYNENKKEKEPKHEKKYKKPEELSGAGYAAVTLTFLLVIFSLYFVNLKPLLANNELLGILISARQGQQPERILDQFEHVFNYNTFGSGEAREQFASYARQIVSMQEVPDKTKIKVLTRAIEELEKQVELSKNKDIRYLIFLTSVYITAGRRNDALNTINHAVELTPTKQQLYFVKADIFISAGDYEQARKQMEIAYNLDTTYTEAATNLVILSVLSGKQKEAEDVLMEHYGKPVIADKRLLNAYARAGNYVKVRDIWLLIIETEPENGQNYIKLATVYNELGQTGDALSALNKATEIDPSLKGEADALMQLIFQKQMGPNMIP